MLHLNTFLLLFKQIFFSQGAASPEELVKRLGGSRVITKILIANNGIAAVSFCLFGCLVTKYCLCCFVIDEILQSAGQMHPRHKAMELRELPIGASRAGKYFSFRFS